MIVAITGSKGFIGSNLIQQINNEIYKVYEIDINDGFDIADKNTLKKIDKFDVIIHLAAKSFVPESYKNSLEFYYTNINSTLNVLELCKIYHARFIYVSSYVYGKPDYLPIDENHPLKPFNPYSQSKIICEILAAAYHRDFNLDGIILRPFNIFGYGQNSNFLIPSILNQLKSGEVNLDDPRPKRDFIYIDDVCDALLKCINYNNHGLEIFNLGSGKSYSVIEIVELISNLAADQRPRIKFSNTYRKEEILDIQADISKAKSLLNWSPRYDMIRGLKSYLKKIAKVKV